MSAVALRRLACGDGETIAYLKRPGKSPGVLWLGGFHSDMSGTKPQALDAWAAALGRCFLRFDYFGHGESSGDFRNGTIGRWHNDALCVLDALCDGPQLLVGSSMGAWIALLLAQARPERIAGLLLLAPAPDFTETLIWDAMTEATRREVLEKGEWLRPSAYEAPYPITRALIEEGRRHLVLGAPIRLHCPIHILHGMKDPDVPWSHALRLVECLDGNPMLTLIKEGDHRLSTPDDLARITAALDAMPSV